MRYLFGAMAMLVLAAPLAAQQTTAPPPLPSIGLPLPPIGLPLPAIGLQREDSRVPQVPQVPDVPEVPVDVRGTHLPMFVIFGSPYGWSHGEVARSATPGVVTPTDPPPPPAPTMGRLRLFVEPADLAQVYVDDVYFGTVEDVRGEVELAPGTRHIELRAPGYEAFVVDVRIIAGRDVTYRGTLVQMSAAPSAPAEPPAPVQPSTFYLIPGCYMGNVPPHLVKLPDGCDLMRVITRTPQAGRQPWP